MDTSKVINRLLSIETWAEELKLQLSQLQEESARMRQDLDAASKRKKKELDPEKELQILAMVNRRTQKILNKAAQKSNKGQGRA